ncbi:MAG: DNA cytosine methyltransferase [Saprospiraceae bacterium]
MKQIAPNQQKLKGYTFIDLFAGIGGFHYALKSYGAKAVFASEIDKKAATVYETNHGLKPHGDITKIEAKTIPKHDILCGGFPCQAFSISGKQKGFEDTRGTLFFDIARIINHHQPKILLLENVKNFVRHNQGETLKTVLSTLENLNYNVFYKVLNTRYFGLPQNRERVYIVGFHKDFYNGNFEFPNQKIVSCLNDILEENPTNGKIIEREDMWIYKQFEPQKNIFGEIELPNRPIQIGKVNKGGQGERIYHPLGHAITLSAHGGGAGSKTGLYQINSKIRKLSPRECARLQGFPEDFILPKSVTEAHRQFGNSVSVNVLQFIIEEIIKTIENGQTSTLRLTDSKKRFQEREGHRQEVQ